MSIVEFDGAPEIPESFPPDFDSDGEDRRERNDYNIAKSVAEFVDEPPIRHNVYPDSEEDEEGENVQRTAYRRSNIRRGNRTLFERQVFISGIAFKEAVLDYALKTGRNIKQYRYDKNKVGYKCEGKGESGKSCSWRIYCATSGKYDKWQVTVFKKDHICAQNGMCEMLKVPVIARLFVDKIREEPEYYMPMKIEELIMEKWKFSVTRPQCQHARNKALRWIEREYDEQFSRLRDYANEIRESNPNSSVEVDCTNNDIFNRFYVCFDVLKRTWKATCRPLIGVDGCFLKSKMKGQLLVALGRDADNAIYPIAWAVVQVENTDNWLWFVRKIKMDLELNDGDGFVMVSDRQKGLISAVRTELPRIEHRMCVRHIYQNLKAKFGKRPEMKKLIWNLAWSYNVADFRQNLLKISMEDPAVYAELRNARPETWCRAAYKLGSYCEDVENNSTESFNNSIGKARDKPFVPMLETIARLAMVRIAKRDIIATDHQSICTPYVIDTLADLHKAASECTVKPSTNMMFDCIHKGCSHRVSLENRTCSCRRWDITGIPCEHAYGVMLRRGLEAQEYVCQWFRTDMWRRTYENGLIPIRGAKFWPVGEDPIIPPEVPAQPGRKKVTKKDKKRKRGLNESPMKKKDKPLKRIMHCGICGEANHNSRFHKKTNVTKPALGEQSSQAESSQGIVTQA